MNIRSEFNSHEFINSQIDRMNFDSVGEPIAGVRLDANEAYDQIPELLQQYINNSDEIAWKKIVSKIDYIYYNIDIALSDLDKVTNFCNEVLVQINDGKKLLFKPNLLAPNAIDDKAHCEGEGCVYSTQWTFVAAVMRWFHDKLQIYYSQMTVAEASPYIITLSHNYTIAANRKITTEAVIEGRSGDFYGGWGFYFVRKYLSEFQPLDAEDDPMMGYEDSITGNYIPPGRAGDRLMVYDLNQIQDDATKGRTVTVPEGANFDEITIHKAVIGGNPRDYNDIRDYPGSILINLPKLKIHAQDLITNAIKNLGIGLYPMKSAEGKGKNDTDWKYAFPDTQNPSLKARLPHSRWVIPLDDKTCLPLTNDYGEMVTLRTEGMSGTQCDIIRAVQNQNIYMLHITDAIYVLNLSHDPGAIPEIIPEGYILVSLDGVALDLFCARYCFNTLPMYKTLKLQQENNWITEFVRHVPVPYIDGKNISTEIGLDSPLFRYNLYCYAQERGIGGMNYYVIGWDTLTDTPLISCKGHLGRIHGDQFIELMTKTMYYNPLTILHDLQKTMLCYAIACDTLTGSTIYSEIMDYFDENQDGVLDYDEKAGGFETAQLCIMSYVSDLKANQEYGILKGNFMSSAYFAKYGDRNNNLQGYEYMKGKVLISTLVEAFKLSQSKEVAPDLYIQGMNYGRGNWPSWETAKYLLTTETIYGGYSIKDISLSSLYGSAFQYADKVQNYGRYTGSIDQSSSTPVSIQNYLYAVSMGANPLNFTLYVPVGYGSFDGVAIPNVEETQNPSKLYTVQYKEMW